MRKVVGVIITCGAFVVSSVSATIIHVPADQPSIQAGINAAGNGDTVLVAQGTYAEHIDFLGKPIVVKGEKGADSTVITKAVDGLSLVTFQSTEDTTSVLQGFTLRGARNVLWGGAVLCNNSSALIIENIITDNQAGAASAILLEYSHAVIRNNLIYANNSSQEVIFTVSGAPIIARNTVTGNVGTGLYISDGSPLVRNNIFTFNSKYGIYRYPASSPVLSHNDVYGNVQGDYFGIVPDAGSFSEDPLFCDTSVNDYQLFDTSPCIGAGEGGATIGAFGVGCILYLRVSVTDPSDQMAYNGTQVFLDFTILNTGLVADSYWVLIADSLGWSLSPTNLSLFLNPTQDTTIQIQMSIPTSAGLGDANRITLEVVSQTNPISHDEASVLVTAVPLCGDVNEDGLRTLSDVIYLVNYIFNKPGNWIPCGASSEKLAKDGMRSSNSYE